MEYEIRQEKESEYFETESVVRRAFFNKFGPGCDEHLMVHRMRNHPLFLKEFSRVAIADGHVVGVIMYFMAKIEADGRVIEVPSFGPLCADHKYKNHGVGGRLLKETLALVKDAGYPGVLIMGEPEYYPKFGFERAASYGLTDAEGNVFDAFMGIEFIPGALHIPGGRFIEPEDLCEFADRDVEEFDKKFEYLLKGIRPCQWTYMNPSPEKDGYGLEYAIKYPREFEAMFAEYVKELAVYDPGLLQHDPKEFVEEIRDNVTDAAYIIMADGETAGLFVPSVPAEPIEDKDCASYLQEMFVRPKYRGRGIAKDIFMSFIRQQKQDTGFCIVPESQSGKYFLKLLDEAEYKYDIYKEDDVRVFVHVHI